MSSKIIVKKPTTASASVATATAVPKASAVAAAPKVVVKASAKVVVKAPQKVVKAPSPVKKAAAPKVVYQEEEEAEDSGSETQPATAQEIYERIQELLGELVGLSGGRGKIKLTKTGKIRKPRGPRENSEKQSAWMDFVKQVREEQGVDENGKFLISHKDAMKLAKEMRAEEAGSQPSEAEEEEAPVPKKAVVQPKKAAAAKKSPQEIRAEFLAKQKAAAEEEQQQEEESAEVEVEEFEHDGKTYLKNSDNLCWLMDAEGNQTWAGAYLPEEDRIDETVEEPLA